MRAALFALPLLPALACAPEDVPPDVVYNVTVKSEVDGDNLVTTCIAEGEQAPVFEQVFRYELYFSGSTVDLRIDGEGFAAGTRSGCDMEYESAVWLEERDAGDVRWSLSGFAANQGAAGGCDDIPEGLDWQGSETITVEESEDESVPVGCTYEMVTEGTLAGG